MTNILESHNEKGDIPNNQREMKGFQILCDILLLNLLYGPFTGMNRNDGIKEHLCRKAFDTVPHVRLLKKLEAYGVAGKLLNWIRDFLSNRKQRVRVGDCMSTEKYVTSGIPQGSILGSVLCTIFINDLPDEVNSFCKIFADDTKIYDKSTNYNRLQEDLNRL